ncbi:NADPH-dependent 7-cyano-7-deazaguanine reductase QueF [bacterium]|nr:NADPH-dependent 7-cyano-7-deazaguanine reductase QueF [bacterium]
MRNKTVKDFVKKPEFKFNFDGTEAIRPDLLETFAYEYSGRRNEVTVETEEFTAVCPWSGLPDYALITVKYVPDNKIIELRSLKYYLYSYRNVGIFQEHLTVRLLDDLVKACAPLEMTVITDYNIRGGIHTVSQASYQKKKTRNK